MNRDEIIDTLVAVAAPILAREYRPDCCVAATRHGDEVLRYFGVPAVPLKVQAIVGNATWRDWMLTRPTPGEPMPDPAWSVGVDLESKEDGRYAGHLVLLADDLLIDLSLGQMARPVRGISLPPAAVFPVGETWAEQGDMAVGISDGESGDESIVLYRRLPERDWMGVPDWTRQPRFAGEMIRGVKARLGRSVLS